MPIGTVFRLDQKLEALCVNVLGRYCAGELPGPMADIVRLQLPKVTAALRRLRQFEGDGRTRVGLEREIYRQVRELDRRLERAQAAMTPSPQAQRCRVCGCDDLHACRLPGGEPCSWVLPDLCSNPQCMRADPRTPLLAGLEAN